MKLLQAVILLVAVAALSTSAWAVAYTASVTGNWSNIATWGGLGPPGNGDTTTINSGIVVTVDTNTTVGASGAPTYSYISSFTITAAGSGGSGACTLTLTGGTLQGAATTTACTLSGGAVATATISSRGWYTAASVAPTCAFSATGLTGSTCTVNWVQGGGTPAITFASSNTNQLAIAQGVTLTTRGDLLNQGLGSANTADLITCPSGGCTLKFDSSAAAAGTDGLRPIYSFGPSGNNGYRSYNFSGCTALQPCVITNDGVAADIFIAFSMHGFSAGGNFAGYNTSVSYCGNANTPCVDLQGSSTFAGNWDSEYNNWDHTGVLRSTTSPAATITFKHLFNRHTNSMDTTCVPNVGTGCAMNMRLDGANTGTWLIENNAFDAPADANYQCIGCVIKNNIFEERPGFLAVSSQANIWNSFDQNFVRKTVNLTSTEAMSGPITNLYLMWDTDTGNPHGFYMTVAMTSSSVSNAVGSIAGSNGGDSGNMFGTYTANPTAGQVLDVTNALAIPATNNHLSGVILDTNQGTTITNLTSGSLAHSTMIANGADAAHMIEVAHCNIKNNNFVTSFKNNYFYGVSNSSNYLIWDGDDISSNVCASSGSSSGSTYTSISPTPDTTVTNNYSFNLTTTAGAWLTNAGNGYIGMFSAVPGTNDQRGIDARFPAAVGAGRRNERNFPTAYLGLSGTKGTWTTSTAYAVGDTVTDSNASVDSGNVILYRALAAHTSAATTEPGIGATWRTGCSGGPCWEWGVLQVVRDAVIANTQYPDGALVGCSAVAPCGITKAIIGWVQGGHVPQNYALWKAGSDGADIGAVAMKQPFFR